MNSSVGFYTNILVLAFSYYVYITWKNINKKKLAKIKNEITKFLSIVSKLLRILKNCIHLFETILKVPSLNKLQFHRIITYSYNIVTYSNNSN